MLSGTGPFSIAKLPFNCDLRTQLECVLELAPKNPIVAEILQRAPKLGLSHWYLGGGCIAQTIWNAGHGFESTYGIRDYDLVYFDPSDLSYEAEDQIIGRARELFNDLDARIELINEARVHLWYPQRFGYAIAPYESVEDAISSWPTTAASIGMCAQPNDSISIYAPFGLNDLLGMIVRPNKTQITRAIYQAKADRWLARWPKLTIVSWEYRAKDPGFGTANSSHTSSLAPK